MTMMERNGRKTEENYYNDGIKGRENGIKWR
jgi:hypothetical protein